MLKKWKQSEFEIHTKIIDDPKVAFDLRLELIARAEKEIKISSLLFSSYESGSILYGALLKKADEGVKVTIITDSFNTKKDKVFKAIASHPNFSYSTFEPNNILIPSTLQHIMHDKVFVIDQRYAIINGRNLSDKFYKVESSTFSLDRDLLIFNTNEDLPIIKEMSEYVNLLVDSKYSKLANYSPNEGIYASLIAEFETYLEETFTPFDFSENIVVANATFVRSPLNRGNKEPVLFNVIKSLAEDEDDIIIRSPYFTSSRLMKKEAFFVEDKNYTLLTNNMNSNPNLMATSNYLLNRKNLVKSHTLYEFQGSHKIHGKAVVIGNEISIIGSQNFYHRSMFLSTESFVVVYSKEFNNALRSSLSSLMEQSLLVQNNGLIAKIVM